MFYIYVFQHKTNYKKYVGKTKDPTKRFLQHKSQAKKPKYYFSKAIAKYGIESFDYYIVDEYNNEKDCLEAEQFWIYFLGTKIPTLGYNLTNGGEGSSGYKHTPEAIAKMRIVNKTKNLGRKHTPEGIAKMSVKQIANHDNNSRMNSGENNPNSKLSLLQIEQIKNSLKENKLTLKELGKIYGVSSLTISRIHRGINWKQTTVNYDQPKIYKNDGERNPKAKLTTTQVIEIRKLAAEGVHYTELAKQFNVSRSTANQIITNRIWKNIH